MKSILENKRQRGNERRPELASVRLWWRKDHPVSQECHGHGGRRRGSSILLRAWKGSKLPSCGHVCALKSPRCPESHTLSPVPLYSSPWPTGDSGARLFPLCQKKCTQGYLESAHWATPFIRVKQARCFLRASSAQLKGGRACPLGHVDLEAPVHLCAKINLTGKPHA